MSGESKGSKRLVMQADGALEKKLSAWVEAQKAWAEALSAAKQGALVPTVVMGGSNGGNGDATNFMNLLTAKTARDLSLDLSVK